MDRRQLLTGLAAVALCAFAPAASVKVTEDGKAVLTVDGAARTINSDTDATDAVLSPDGRSVAWVRISRYSEEEGSYHPTDLHLYDVAGGRDRVLLESNETDDPRTNLRSFASPRFSPDGGLVYILVYGWGETHAVHEVNVATGAHRFVADANSLAVIRSGRYAGYLLVKRRVEREGQGAHEPTFVVRPDGGESILVPGSGEDETAVERWMKENAAG